MRARIALVSIIVEDVLISPLQLSIVKLRGRNMYSVVRKHRRFLVYGQAFIVMINEKNPTAIRTHIKNISDGAIGIFSAEADQSGSEISINIEFQVTKEKKVSDKIKGKVVWEYRQRNMYQMGIQFDEEISPVKQPDLHRHFNTFIKRVSPDS